MKCKVRVSPATDNSSSFDRSLITTTRCWTNWHATDTLLSADHAGDDYKPAAAAAAAASATDVTSSRKELKARKQRLEAEIITLATT
jgi:hypothetical protein